MLSNGITSGGGHGGKGGAGCYNGSCVEGGISYGNADLPCELGSGSGNDTSANSTAGGGIIGKLLLLVISRGSFNAILILIGTFECSHN